MNARSLMTHYCLCGIAPTARPARIFNLTYCSPLVYDIRHAETRAAGKAKRRIELLTKNGENCSFRSERTAYRHNLANPAQIWFESRAAAPDLAPWRRSRAIPCAVPWATMQNHQTKCTVSCIGREKKQRWVVSSTVSSLFPQVFFAISHSFFRNRRTSAFAINHALLSQLDYTLSSTQHNTINT